MRRKLRHEEPVDPPRISGFLDCNNGANGKEKLGHEEPVDLGPIELGKRLDILPAVGATARGSRGDDTLGHATRRSRLCLASGAAAELPRSVTE